MPRDTYASKEESEMARCLVCGHQPSIVGSVLLMRRFYRCPKCSSLLTVEPRSVFRVGALNAVVIVSLGVTLAVHPEVESLVAVPVWLVAVSALYSKAARLKPIVN